jgi:hypothetical protein
MCERICRWKTCFPCLNNVWHFCVSSVGWKWNVVSGGVTVRKDSKLFYKSNLFSLSVPYFLLLSYQSYIWYFEMNMEYCLKYGEHFSSHFQSSIITVISFKHWLSGMLQTTDLNGGNSLKVFFNPFILFPPFRSVVWHCLCNIIKM